MPKEIIPQVCVGIDISKDHLDVCLRPGDQRMTLSNDAGGSDQLNERLGKEASPLIVMEATGYDVPIAGSLLSKGLPSGDCESQACKRLCPRDGKACENRFD